MYYGETPLSESSSESHKESESESESESDPESESDSELSEQGSDESNESEQDENIIDIIANHTELMNVLDPPIVTNGKYYIGCYTILTYRNMQLKIVLENKIHPKTFMKFDSNAISDYFFWYSRMVFSRKPTVDILQLQIDRFDRYTVVIKTYWIKIIQRTWKRVYAERKKYLEYRRRISTIRDYELGRQIPIGRYLGLYGLLNHY